MLVEMFRSWPRPMRWAYAFGLFGGTVGGLVGLVVGLGAYPPTAWFAVLELGVPTALVGGLIGLVAGTVAAGLARMSRRRTPAV